MPLKKATNLKNRILKREFCFYFSKKKKKINSIMNYRYLDENN